MSRSEGIVAPQSDAEDVIETDSLVEEVSIDGMCGVY
ncbi:mycofactocin precursor MftA [Agromyces sp. ZXT2-6]